MFGPGAEPLAWDTENAYTRDRLELYYMSYAATPLSATKLAEVEYFLLKQTKACGMRELVVGLWVGGV